MLKFTSLIILAVGTKAQTTCADKKAAKVDGVCIEPVTFSADATFKNLPLPSSWLGPAPVCYTQYYHNQLATPTWMPADSMCSAYANQGCCSSELVKSIDDNSYGTVDIYEGYDSRCGPISAECNKFFSQEACFYECDHNIGKYRMNKDENCLDKDGTENAWQIYRMPLSGKLADMWFNACKDDLFCTGPSGSYFELPTTKCTKPEGKETSTSTCKKFSDIYYNASNMISKLWDNSFVYEQDESKAYTFFPKGARAFESVGYTNPNDIVHPEVSEPPFCNYRETIEGWSSAYNDFKIYADNMLKYGKQIYSGKLDKTNGSNSWFIYSAPAPPPPSSAKSPSSNSFKPVYFLFPLSIITAVLL